MARGSATSRTLALDLRVFGSMDSRELEAIVLEMQEQLNRHAIVIERLATEFHALLMVLTQKGVATLDSVRAAERKLDLASEVARARQLADMTADLETLDRELDEKDRRGDPE